MELRCVPEVPPSVSSGHGLAALLACTAAVFPVLCSGRTLRRCGFPLLVCMGVGLLDTHAMVCYRGLRRTCGEGCDYDICQACWVDRPAVTMTMPAQPRTLHCTDETRYCIAQRNAFLHNCACVSPIKYFALVRAFINAYSTGFDHMPSRAVSASRARRSRRRSSGWWDPGWAACSHSRRPCARRWRRATWPSSGNPLPCPPVTGLFGENPNSIREVHC